MKSALDMTPGHAQGRALRRGSHTAPYSPLLSQGW